jgi:hypothetical protein
MGDFHCQVPRAVAAVSGESSKKVHLNKFHKLKRVSLFRVLKGGYVKPPTPASDTHLNYFLSFLICSK